MSGQRSSSESEDDSDDSSSDEEMVAHNQRTGVGGTLMRAQQPARVRNNEDNPPPYAPRPATQIVRRPVVVPERRHPHPAFPARTSPALTRSATGTPFAMQPISSTFLDAAQRAASQAIHEQEAHLELIDAAARTAVKPGNATDLPAVPDLERREAHSAVDEESTSHQATIEADVHHRIRTSPPAPTQAARARINAQSTEEEDRVVRRAARVARQEQKGWEDQARRESEATNERRRLRKLARREQEDEEYEYLSVDEDEELTRSSRKRQRVARRSLTQTNDAQPRIKQESSGVFAPIARRVLIKEESPSFTLVQEAGRQGTSQPEVKTEQLEKGSPSHSPTQETQHQGTPQLAVQNQQQDLRYALRSRPEPASSSSDEEDVDLPLEDGSSSRERMQAADGQGHTQPQHQGVPLPQSEHAIRYAPLINLHLAAQTKLVTGQDWIAAGRLVHPDRYVGLDFEVQESRWRDVARSAYNRSERDKQLTRLASQQQQQTGQQITAIPPSKRATKRLRLAMKKADREAKEKLKAERMAPLVALHIASLHRPVPTDEWMAVREQVNPRGWGRKASTIVENMQAAALHAYVCHQQADVEARDHAGGQEYGAEPKVYNTRSGLH